jgi:ribosome-associated protein
MEKIRIRDEFIKLGQALKLAGIAESGVDAKDMILNGEAKVNGEVDLRRGRKLYDGDVVDCNGKQFMVTGKNAD